uniref:hypothetical protein n=1 Tax=Rhodoferax sp. TaxID=50421 RepID=UPI00351D655D
MQLHRAVAALSNGDPSFRQGSQTGRQDGRQAPQRPGQHLLQDIRRGAESAATVLMRLYIPTHSDASAITPARQDNAQRARL